MGKKKYSCKLRNGRHIINTMTLDSVTTELSEEKVLHKLDERFYRALDNAPINIDCYHPLKEILQLVTQSFFDSPVDEIDLTQEYYQIMDSFSGTPLSQEIDELGIPLVDGYESLCVGIKSIFWYTTLLFLLKEGQDIPNEYSPKMYEISSTLKHWEQRSKSTPGIVLERVLNILEVDPSLIKEKYNI